jgi:hypothetical protein
MPGIGSRGKFLPVVQVKVYTLRCPSKFGFLAFHSSMECASTPLKVNPFGVDFGITVVLCVSSY